MSGVEGMSLPSTPPIATGDRTATQKPSLALRGFLFDWAAQFERATGREQTPLEHLVSLAVRSGRAGEP
jgi:hypothetical protein